MKHNVVEALEGLIEPVDDLVLLPNNARQGHLRSIAASLDEFGQHTPIVVQRSSNTILKGNNTYRAATEILHWTHVAVAWVDDDDATALGRALIDNRTSDLGTYDEKLRSDQIVEAAEYMPEVFDAAGWDRYVLAEIEMTTIPPVPVTEGGGFTPPALISTPSTPSPGASVAPSAPSHLEAPADIDVTTAATQGAGAVGIQSGSTQKAVTQYTLVFENPDDNTKWFRFLRWLRSDPAYDGETVGERVINFIDAHADYE